MHTKWSAMNMSNNENIMTRASATIANGDGDDDVDDNNNNNNNDNDDNSRDDKNSYTPEDPNRRRRRQCTRCYSTVRKCLSVCVSVWACMEGKYESAAMATKIPFA